MSSFFSRKKRIGLSIAGGGIKTIFALGVTSVLSENKISFSSISATSAGTITALTALHQNQSKMFERICDLSEKIKQQFRIEKFIQGKQNMPYTTFYKKFIYEYCDKKIILHNKTKLLFYALKLPDSVSKTTNNASFKRIHIVAQCLNAYRKDNQLYNKYPYKQKAQIIEIANKYNLTDTVFEIYKEDSLDNIFNTCLACSSVPPFLHFKDAEQNKYYLDGGFKHNLPIQVHPKNTDFIIGIYYKPKAFDIAKTLAPEIHKKTFYIFPDRQIPLHTWDIPNRKTMVDIYQSGREQAENVIRLLHNYM